jgi:hypothetical protein
MQFISVTASLAVLILLDSASATTTASACTPIMSAPPVGDYVYAGCQSEADNGRTLNLATLVDSSSMTPQKCATFCAGKRLPLFGVEYGSECYCGTYPRDTSVATEELDCDMPCVGDSTRSCGGRDLLDMYALTNYTVPSIPATVSDYWYKGCYTDWSSSGRALGGASVVNYDSMTLETCAAFCSGKSFSIFGLEYAGECWCGNTLAFGSVVAPNGDDECTSTCPGDYTQLACGDSKRLSVYSKK